MKDCAYLIVHKDHPLDVTGINSGAEMATLFLARYLAKTGRRVVVAAQLVGKEQEDKGVEFWDLGPSFDVGVILERARELTAYHLISAGRAQPILESRRESACKSRLLISHDRAGNDTGIRPEVLCRSLDTVICVSNAQKKVFLAAGADPKKVRVIHNGVDLNLFPAGKTDQRNLRKLVFVGALVQDKGLHVLLQSFIDLKKKYHDLSLDVYGSASLWGRSDYLNLVDIAKQVPGVVFHDKQPQEVVAKAYQQAGICVVPSIWFDPFPLTAIEAQVSGCPVVTFDVGGLPEGVRDQETGIVVREISVQALSGALDGLLGDAGRLVQMSNRALHTARDYFNWERVAQEIIAVSEHASAHAAPAQQQKPAKQLVKKRLGVVSTWNQQCGLATYAKYLFSNLESDSLVVFAEDSVDANKRADEPFVKRCWNRAVNDFSALRNEFARADVGLLHLNFHDHLFIKQPNFSEFLKEVRARGVPIVTHLHTTFSYTEECRRFLQLVDGVVVHTAENRLQAIANGAPAEKVFVLPHGVHIGSSQSETSKLALRDKYSIPRGEKVIVSAGFVQPNKGMEGVIQAVAQLKALGIPAQGFILGRVNERHPEFGQYYEALKKLAIKSGVSDRLTFVDRFLSDDELADYLAVADLVLMNYQSQYYEASGACSLAIGAGAVVATSIAPTFSSFSDAVWHITSGFPAGPSAALLLTDQRLRAELLSRSKEYCQKNNWFEVAKRLVGVYEQFGFIPVGKKEKVVETKKSQNNSASTVRVLMQNRPNVLTQRGGDTVVMERLAEGLRAAGVEVTVDVMAKENPAHYDLVHLFNFALPDFTRTLAQRAHQAGKPFVVTTLYEDGPSYRNQAIQMATFLMEYERLGQDPKWYQDHLPHLPSVTVSDRFNNEWTVEYAAALFTNGSRESATIRRDYPNSGKIFEVSLGAEVDASGDPALFEREYGIKDFVLCVGRFEWRKNQLMLLKALESSDFTLVLAGGGFSYDPDYEQAVRRFKRAGKTVVLGRLSPEMLASAYAAARVHVLPSWYELPGLVSLEAALNGCNIVATTNGTAPDYFGERAFYCDPASESAIRNAIIAAWYTPKSRELALHVAQYSWAKTIHETMRAYEQVLGRAVHATPRAMSTVATQPVTAATPTAAPASAGVNLTQVGYDMAPGVNEFQELIDRAELCARERNFAEGHALLEKAEQANPKVARIHRVRGAFFLAEGQQQPAREYFSTALQLDPSDSRSMSGLGMCEMIDQRFDTAYAYFVQALEVDPMHLTSLMQLVDCSYRVAKFTDLERVLRAYIEQNQNDLEMQFCLAGCLYKQQKFDDAERVNKAVLARNPTHLGGKQLAELLLKAPKQQEDASIRAQVEVIRVPETAGSTTEKTFSALQQALTALSGQKIAAVSDASTPAVAEAAATQSVPVAGARFDTRDQKLMELEEEKRKRNYDAVREGLKSLASASLNAEQREQANLLEAEVLVQEGKLAEAASRYDTVIASNPKCSRALCGKGALAAHDGDWAKAKQFFSNAHAYRTTYDVPLAGLGLCAWAEKDNEQAWHFYQQALKMNPENLRALLGVIELGYSLQRLGEVEQALKSYLELHPLDLDFVYSLAGCYFAQQRLDEAVEEVKKITMFEPNHTRALELQRMIDERKTGARPSTVEEAVVR